MNEAALDIATFHPLEIKALLAFGEEGAEMAEAEVASKAAISEAQCRRALELLKTRSLVDVASEQTQESVELTELGRTMAETGVPEAVILRESDEQGGLTPKEVRELKGLDPALAGPALGTLKKLGLVEFHEGGLVAPAEGALARAAEMTTLVTDLLGGPLPLSKRSAFEGTYISEKSRKRGKGSSLFAVRRQTERSFALTTAGAKALALARARGVTGEEITALTADMIAAGSWKGKHFRKYNIQIAPPRVNTGRKHPYRIFLDNLKATLRSLGFMEMKGSLVEPEFWNMDALFMPQFHSARDIHDAYRVREPALSPLAAQPFLDRVRAAHRDGGDTGSIGWNYDFDVERSRRNIFRSHGTVLSARTLASGPEIPGKYFAVARCFRPDKVDATHAPDFLQVEGIVLGEDINFRTLLGLLTLFAKEIARSPEVKFLPDYFPFTEPSVSVHMKHPVLGWTELGGAGIFRPEVTKPLGVDVPVIAWGLGIDRMALVALGINDIRDLFTRDLNVLRQSRYPM